MGEADLEKKGWWRRALVIWMALWSVTLALALQPVATRLWRLGFMVCLGLLWVGAIALSRKKKWFAVSLLTLGAVVLLLPLLPGRAFDAEALRAAYVRNLNRYEGVPYVWGGENELGVDCSGFPRRALMRANVVEGLKSLNGTLVRTGLSMWWNDTSARALWEEYRGLTRTLFEAPNANVADASRLLPGDLAVTTNGVHVLVYVGDKTWLEADPGYGRVIRVRTPASGNGWFDTPIRLMRWTQLDAQKRA